MRIVNHTGESSIVSIRRDSRVFLQLGLKFTSIREEFHVDMYIFLSLVLFGTYGRVEESGKEMK